MEWLISANTKIYDCASAFDSNGYIDWRQNNRKYNIGDTVFIYCTNPLMKIMYKAVITATNLTPDEIVDDSIYWNDKEQYFNSLKGLFIRIQLVDYIDSDMLSLNNLKDNGLNGAPQGPIKVVPTLSTYINDCFNNKTPLIIDDSDEISNTCIEGAKKTIIINKYERNPIARQKCIAHYGTSCTICNFNFSRIYGDIGNNFIHVHHLKPLHEIKDNYIVDPINDLIPVCPNCHAMLHRKKDNSYLSVEELRSLMNNNYDNTL